MPLATDKTRVLNSKDREPDYAFTRNIPQGIPANYEISPALGYGDALGRFSRNKCDVHLPVYQLGGKTALDGLRHLLARPLLTATIVITGKTDRSIDGAVPGSGTPDYLSKDSPGAEVLGRTIGYSMHRRLPGALVAAPVREKRRIDPGGKRTVHIRYAEAG